MKDLTTTPLSVVVSCNRYVRLPCMTTIRKWFQHGFHSRQNLCRTVCFVTLRLQGIAYGQNFSLSLSSFSYHVSLVGENRKITCANVSHKKGTYTIEDIFSVQVVNGIRSSRLLKSMNDRMNIFKFVYYATARQSVSKVGNSDNVKPMKNYYQMLA